MMKVMSLVNKATIKVMAIDDDEAHDDTPRAHAPLEWPMFILMHVKGGASVSKQQQTNGRTGVDGNIPPVDDDVVEDDDEMGSDEDDDTGS
jgi:hypothetical protein